MGYHYDAPNRDAWVYCLYYNPNTLSVGCTVDYRTVPIITEVGIYVIRKIQHEVQSITYNYYRCVQSVWVCREIYADSSLF